MNKSGKSTTLGDMVLNRDFKEFIKSLNDKGVRYLVVGGYAVAAHGHPRYTKDLDVWIELSQENAAKIVKALAEFGFGGLGLKTDDFLERDQFVQLGQPPNRIDILTSLSGVHFDQCFNSRVTITVEGVSVNFIGLSELKRNKSASGRLQDLADVETLGSE